ncbi:hypothetical protein EJ07DRAFT_179655 [Lizonia empirigonia]|nr:hypothetical protein EJ07DRAFT_179655 [Lizonia empirigonia]
MSGTVLYADFDQYSPSEDSDFDPSRKPPLPYRIGFQFSAASHKVPHPFGEPPPHPENWQSLSQTEYCLTQCPRDDYTRPDVIQKLKITSIISTGSDRGAQLVVVNDNMVAKIYDPLYYDELDCVRRAFGDYNREAAAYNKLQKSLAAKNITPIFHGTWFTEIATPFGSYGQQHIHKRIVHLILMEHLQGECMLYVDPHNIRRRTRSRILKQVLDAECSSYDAPDLRVKIVDFNIAAVIGNEDGLDWLDKLEQLWPGRLCSPLVRHFGSMMDFSAYGWCSSEDTEAQKWLWRHYKDDSRYFPVEWNPKDPHRRPD